MWASITPQLCGRGFDCLWRRRPPAILACLPSFLARHRRREAAPLKARHAGGSRGRPQLVSLLFLASALSAAVLCVPRYRDVLSSAAEICASRVVGRPYPPVESLLLRRRTALGSRHTGRALSTASDLPLAAHL